MTSARVLATGFTLLEGPRWRPDGLYVSDFHTESVLRFPSPETSDAHEVVCRIPGRPSGLGFDPDGTLLVVSMLQNALYRVGPDGPVVVAEFGDLVSGPSNDMYVDARGRAYIGGFGASPTDDDVLAPTSLIRVDPDGTVSVAASDLIFPNGITKTPDGRTLYVAESYASRVTRFAVGADGALTDREAFVDRRDGAAFERVSVGDVEAPWLPDGLAMDIEGGLWVADCKGSGITRFDAAGRQTDVVSSGDLSVYAGALGGADGRTLFLCCAPPVGTFDPVTTRSSALLTARVEIPAVEVPA